MKAYFKKHVLNFIRPGGTSRGVLKTKDSYFIFLEEKGKTVIGECGILKGLSADDVPEYEKVLQWTCLNIHLGLEVLRIELLKFPSIVFALEQAFTDLKTPEPFNYFKSDFTSGQTGIPINGLIWMGKEDFMRQQIAEKLKAGFGCLKMKIGALDWKKEKDILKSIRKEFRVEDLELRVDANGAFSPLKAKDVLQELYDLNVHSIEQPIKKGMWQEMARLCEETPTPIALDEDLIGVFQPAQQTEMLETIHPQYIILKPSFIGGWQGSDQWIEKAEKLNCGWWITSALESNIGLNAIAQYTFTKKNNRAQGLGTGSLFSNNVDSPLKIEQGKLYHQQNNQWNCAVLEHAETA